MDLALAAGGAFTVFFASPLLVLAANVADFQNVDATLILLICAGVALVGALVAVGLAMALLNWTVTRAAATAIIRFAFFFTLLTALALPLAVSAGQVEVTAIPINTTNLAIAVAGGLILAAVSYTRLRGLLLTIAAFALVGSTAVAGYTFLSSTAPNESDALFEASSTENIFAISFDGVPRDVALEVLAENPELQPAFKDFVVFSQVISSAPATFSSLMSETSGIHDLKQYGATERELDGNVAAQGLNIPTVLSKHNYRVSTYSSYNCCLLDPAGHHEMGRLVGLGTLVDRAFEVMDYGLARALSGRVAVTRKIARRVAMVSGAASAANLQARILAHKGRDWDVAEVLTILDFENYLEKLSVATDESVAHFLHYTFTHFPVDFDRHCEYRSDDLQWYNASQNREGLKEQTYCALTQFARFVARLKSIGAYDNAVVILKSDHGEPVEWMDPSRYEGFSIRHHEYWGFGRYMPFLAIKAKDRTADHHAIDTRHVALSDLANTLCRAANRPAMSCDGFDGVDLLSNDPVPDDATYAVYLVKSAESDFRMDTLESIELPRNRRFEEALNDYLTSEMIAGQVPCDVEMQFETAAVDDAPAPEPWVRWAESGVSYVKFASPDCPSRNVEVRMRMNEGAAPETIKVLVDGRNAAYSVLARSGADVTIGLNLAAAETPRVVAVSDGTGSPVDLLGAIFRREKN